MKSKSSVSIFFLAVLPLLLTEFFSIKKRNKKRGWDHLLCLCPEAPPPRPLPPAPPFSLGLILFYGSIFLFFFAFFFKKSIFFCFPLKWAPVCVPPPPKKKLDAIFFINKEKKGNPQPTHPPEGFKVLSFTWIFLFFFSLALHRFSRSFLGRKSTENPSQPGET